MLNIDITIDRQMVFRANVTNVGSAADGKRHVYGWEASYWKPAESENPVVFLRGRLEHDRALGAVVLTQRVIAAAEEALKTES